MASIPGVADSVGHNEELVDAALQRVERLRDEDILAAICGIPVGTEWNAMADRRRSIGEWLAVRRDNLRAPMEAWART